jgi:DNA repair photolyase
MLCPLLPGIADDLESIEELVQIGLDIGAEEFFAEPVNLRGRALIHTAEALRQASYNTEAAAIDRVRNKIEWSGYVVRLVGNVQAALRAQGVLGKLRFLLYPAGLTAEDAAFLREHGDGVVWLGKE